MIIGGGLRCSDEARAAMAAALEGDGAAAVTLAARVGSPEYLC